MACCCSFDGDEREGTVWLFVCRSGADAICVITLKMIEDRLHFDATLGLTLECRRRRIDLLHRQYHRQDVLESTVRASRLGRT